MTAIVTNLAGMPATGFKIKFDGEEHQIDANTLINSLIHTTTIIQEINRSLNPDRKIEVKVKAPEKSSFLIQLQVVDIAQLASELITRQNIETTAWIVTSLVGLFQIKKHLSGTGPKSVEKRGDTTKIENKHGDIINIDNSVFNIYEKNSTVRDALTRNFANLESEPSITGFEILDESDEELFRVDSSNFDELAQADITPQEDELKRVENAVLNIARLSFEKDLLWDFYYKGHKIKAKIGDPTFQTKIDNGESFAKGDVLDTQLEITQKWDESVQTHINKSYRVIKIINHRRRDRSNQANLF